MPEKAKNNALLPSQQQTWQTILIGEQPEDNKIFQATGMIDSTQNLITLKKDSIEFTEDFVPQKPYNNETERKEEEPMPESDALHITNKRIDDAISQTRDIVERGIAENKALFNSLDAKLSGLIEEQKDTRNELKSIKDSQRQQSYFIFGTLLSTIIGLLAIGISVYIGLAQIAVSVTQMAKPPEPQPANVYVLPQQHNPVIQK